MITARKAREKLFELRYPIVGVHELESLVSKALDDAIACQQYSASFCMRWLRGLESVYHQELNVFSFVPLCQKSQFYFCWAQ